MINQVGGRLHHAPGATARTDPTSFATEGHKLLIGTVAAPQAEKAVGEDPALQEGIELKHLRRIEREFQTPAKSCHTTFIDPLDISEFLWSLA